MKSVSIIIPVHQVSDQIERCLLSVMKQTCTDIECIIVDDATKDDSIEKCKKIIGDYSGPIRFLILRHEYNKGLSAARNTGTQAANGEFLYYLDGDDEITPDCIEKMVEIVELFPKAEMVVGNHCDFHYDGRKNTFLRPDFPSRILYEEEISLYYQKRMLPRSAWNKLLRRSFVLQNHLFFKEGILFEDTLWTFYVLKVISKLYVLNQVTYHYHIRPNSIVTGTDDYTEGKNFCIIYDEIFRNLKTGKESVELNRYVEGFCERYLRCKKGVSSYETLMKEYRNLTMKFRCISAFVKLSLTCFLDKNPWGLFVIHQLYDIKKKLTIA